MLSGRSHLELTVVTSAVFRFNISAVDVRTREFGSVRAPAPAYLTHVTQSGNELLDNCHLQYYSRTII
jgi:hypothetical protein